MEIYEYLFYSNRKDYLHFYSFQMRGAALSAVNFLRGSDFRTNEDILKIMSHFNYTVPIQASEFPDGLDTK